MFKKKVRKFMILLTLGAMGCGNPQEAKAQHGDGLFADIITDKGTITLMLEFQKTPLTVASFVGLSEGTIRHNRGEGVRFYDGLTFHRVEPGFVIQGGDPNGNGTGGPGYRFADEIDPTLRHDSAGILSMANAGPTTNGSQFFITLGRASHLDGRHAVFGRVVSGMDVVQKIERGDVINNVVITRVGTAAQEFKTDQSAFEQYARNFAQKKEMEEMKVIEDQKKIVAEKYPGALVSESGIHYIVETAGSGQKPTPGQRVSVHYTGTFLDGRKFDSSRDRNDTFKFNVGEGQVIRGWDEAVLDMQVGERRTIVLPPELGYGKRGAGGVIPPNTYLVFDVELISID